MRKNTTDICQPILAREVYNDLIRPNHVKAGACRLTLRAVFAKRRKKTKYSTSVLRPLYLDCNHQPTRRLEVIDNTFYIDFNLYRSMKEKK